jgi:hypothetical protein
MPRYTPHQVRFALAGLAGSRTGVTITSQQTAAKAPTPPSRLATTAYSRDQIVARPAAPTTRASTLLPVDMRAEATRTIKSAAVQDTPVPQVAVLPKAPFTATCKTGQVMIDGKCAWPPSVAPQVAVLPRPVISPTLDVPIAATPETVKLVLQANAGQSALKVPTAAVPATVVPAIVPATSTQQTLQTPVTYDQPGSVIDTSSAYPSAPQVSSSASSASAEEVQAAAPAAGPSSTAKAVATVGLMAAVPLVMGFFGDH